MADERSVGQQMADADREGKSALERRIELLEQRLSALEQRVKVGF